MSETKNIRLTEEAENRLRAYVSEAKGAGRAERARGAVEALRLLGVDLEADGDPMDMPLEEVKGILRGFAAKNGVELIEEGEVGFGRNCVGFVKNGKYIDHNPYDMATFEEIPSLCDERLFPPDEVLNAYHKHRCLCVLAPEEDYGLALRELLIWVRHLEAQGEVKIVSYSTGASGAQALFSGTTAMAATIQ